LGGLNGVGSNKTGSSPKSTLTEFSDSSGGFWGFSNQTFPVRMSGRGKPDSA
ncbi:7765_t:CDS:2, partial [Funneliformis geosporum]